MAMAASLERIVNHMITQNNYKMNIAFPAVVVGVEKLQDGFIDVQPLINYTNPLTLETHPYPTLRGISVVFPTTKNSTICFPVNQGDFVDLVMQSQDIQSFVAGTAETHDPVTTAYNNLSNVVAFVGFTPYQDSCFNPNNYKNDFDNQDLNIVHNKNSENEVSVTLKSDGDVVIKSPTKVTVESKEVDVVADTVNLNNTKMTTMSDIEVQGMSLFRHMTTHTHIDSEGKPTSPPQSI